MMVVKDTLQNMTGVTLKSIAPGEAQMELSGQQRLL